ncbi:unnamed protein product [Musa banksii]
MLFMPTSALTVSGLAAVEMENLSSAQIVVLSLLMFHGGKVFVTLLGLLFGRGKQDEPGSSAGRVDSACIELESVDPSQNTIDRIESGISPAAAGADESSVRSLGYVVSGYVAIFHLIGTSLLLGARGILKTKGIDVFLFCLSATVSSFANGGLIASNENMAIMNKDPVVLLLMIAQVLGGNTVFPLQEEVSQLSYIAIIIIAICITERRKMTRDPHNFSTLKLIFEVISGYRNVGLPTGHSCWRLLRLHPQAYPGSSSSMEG